ncbi:GGCT-like protein [Mya arenaria]|uniref:gamma-glutamylcyclotransferase n=1 Tax=Mya arenaria TaxID=6604 RepID=A0ABY7EY83_MYAAR|nr:gamma-glutamylcyclotransferase-like [Mya arenaria]WAR13384.1 GGCT-like protein [Mya arenaria]
MTSFLYFAYGSNLLRQRLQVENPSARFVSSAKLEGYRLGFTSLGMDPMKLRWRGGAATILDDPGHVVWGCVWRVSTEHRDSLDRQELIYNPIEVKVTDGDNAVYTCRTYQLPAEYLVTSCYDNRPSPMYMDVIVRGALQNALPAEYVDDLRAVEHNGHYEDIDLHKNILKILEKEK